MSKEKQKSTKSTHLLVLIPAIFLGSTLKPWNLNGPPFRNKTKKMSMLV